MQPELGRFFENRLREVQNVLLVLHDYATGQSRDVKAWVDGRELVFGMKEREGFGFLRVLPQEASVSVAFPRGHELPDPQKRAKGPAGARTKLLVRTTADVDLYVRRMIDAAYALDRK